MSGSPASRKPAREQTPRPRGFSSRAWCFCVGHRQPVTEEARAAHDTFYYYRGPRLEAVRHGDWKLQIASAAKKDDAFQPKLYNLRTDIGEAKDVAAANPDVVKKLESLVAAMKDDLGVDGAAKGSRELGKVKDARPLIDKDGKIRPGFEPMT